MPRQRGKRAGHKPHKHKLRQKKKRTREYADRAQIIKTKKHKYPSMIGPASKAQQENHFFPDNSFSDAKQPWTALIADRQG